MKRSPFLFLALISFAFGAGRAAERPRHGGTLRVETRASLPRIDPARWPADPAVASLQEKLLGLVCDRLVRLDESGKPQPALAIDWQQSADHKSWIFQLRPGVKFHDGTPLNAADIAAVLASVKPGWRITAPPAPSGAKELAAIVISPDSPLPDLPIELAAPQYSIFRRDAQTNFVGTGPFRIAGWQPGRRATFTANDQYWSGRPFLDAVEFAMGRAPREQLLDLELGQTDVVEVLPDQVRQLATVLEVRARVWASRPVELLALVFEQGAVSANERARQALALSIDRATLRDVSLQKQGEVAGGLLPQWLGGYEFLFATSAQTERARQLWSDGEAAPLKLTYDSSDPVARGVAERIAVNARAAGISVQLRPESSAAGDVKLVRLRIDTIDPRRALLHLATTVGISDAVRWPDNADPAQLYAAERELLAGNRLIPIVVLPETYALGPQVKNWMAVPFPAGGWRLEDVWLERESR